MGRGEKEEVGVKKKRWGNEERGKERGRRGLKEKKGEWERNE